MYNNYNINQTVLSIKTDWEPKENHPARMINQIVEDLKIKDPYIFGRPRKYDLRVLLKLILFAYTKGIFSSRRINTLAEENLAARWLTQEQVPAYRTICRFRISDEVENLINQCIQKLTKYLKQNNFIDEVTFIDGTKILADANKYSFVWRKNTIRFDKLNRSAIISLLEELNEAKFKCQLPAETDLTLEMLDEIILRLENNLKDLNKKIEKEHNSPNPDKSRRRKLKSLKRKLKLRQTKLLEYKIQTGIYGKRNSYSKTDHDATFMRVKEDSMLNGQLKPAYNLQIATSKQFVTAFGIFQNPGDTKTLIPFLQQQKAAETLGKYIVADAGYGSESNYRYFEDELPEHTALIPYGTMLKENSRKWQSDDRKVMNWTYHPKDDYFIDPQGVRFSFYAYRKRKDKYGFVREFKEYKANKYDNDFQVDHRAFTKNGNPRKISINDAWEYFKAKERKLLSNYQTGSIYGRRKIDVESVFGGLKACLGFKRFSVRGLEKVKKEAGIALMAMNIRKLVARVTNYNCFINKKKRLVKIKEQFSLISSFLKDLWHSPLFLIFYPLASH
ncbi:IS1182 family transposase [Liquorilactobacillus mali]|nr:IS1182 family transposase [Liquorilactobacillus mali]QFQ74133.1 IS1182 family transposase [Liquorilactobacillus mali]